MYCTGESKYIVRDGEKKLQQKWVSSFQNPALTQVEEEWWDVPCEQEQPKTEEASEIMDSLHKAFIKFLEFSEPYMGKHWKEDLVTNALEQILKTERERVCNEIIKFTENHPWNPLLYNKDLLLQEIEWIIEQVRSRK
jgi:hypothetical protein